MRQRTHCAEAPISKKLDLPGADGRLGRHTARPADRSFEAYTAFLESMAKSLGIAQDLSEDELRRGWQKFWEAADSVGDL